MAKNAQKSIKSSKIAVFRFLENESPIEINRNTCNQKLVIKRNEITQNIRRSKP